MYPPPTFLEVALLFTGVFIWWKVIERIDPKLNEVKKSMVYPADGSDKYQYYPYRLLRDWVFLVEWTLYILWTCLCWFGLRYIWYDALGLTSNNGLWVAIGWFGYFLWFMRDETLREVVQSIVVIGTVIAVTWFIVTIGY
ncbi:hypothetical protein N9478_10360 [Gammaproteobacteria bacterium]|nr:hypothetical protein [Gammaproteobacteria bacterium]